MPKAPVLDPQFLLERLLRYLSRAGPSTAKSLCDHLHTSQSSLSRLIQRAGRTCLRMGRGRQTLYACHRTGSWGISHLPVILINEAGQETHAATLHPLSPSGFYLESLIPQFVSRAYKTLPYFFEDLRPSGFLGRLVPRLYPEAALPEDITAWTDDHCLTYLSRYGRDLVGNIIIGEKSCEDYVRSLQERWDVIEDSRRESRYPQLADLVMSKGIPGSSAAGEQPKFLSIRKTKTGLLPVMVKFSPPITDTLSRRVADLLVCEHINHDILQKHEKTSLKSCLIRGAGRLFLEVERFDRNTVTGRRGVISLRALDLEFVGHLQSWSDTAQSLLQQNKISPADCESLVWLEVFGRLIGNSDRHHGNISFFCNGETITGLAPVYDMLPMMYAPRQNQLVNRPFEPDLPKFFERPVWKSALEAACDFWSKIQTHPEISGEFKALTADNEPKLVDSRGVLG